VVDALPDIEQDKPINLSRVYLYAIKRKMERDIKADRTFTSLADKLYFLCELSWEMLVSDQMSLNYRDFPDRLRQLFPHSTKIQKDIDHWRNDMAGQTMLIRNADGDYSPAHRSLLEFFVAYKFCAELGVLASDFVEIAGSASNIDKTLVSRKYKWSGYFSREIESNNKFKPIPALQNFEAEPIETLKKTVGKQRFTYVILELMRNMIDREALWSFFDRVSSIEKNEDTFLGGNILSLLSWIGEELHHHDFSNLNLKGAYFNLADLTGINFSMSNLEEALFYRVILKEVNFHGANMNNVQFKAPENIDGIGVLGEKTENLLVSRDGFISVISLADGKVVEDFSLRDYSHVVLIDKSNLALTNRRSNSLVVWNLDAKKIAQESELSNTSIVDCVFNATSDIFIVLRSNGQIDILDWPSLSPSAQIKPFDVGNRILCSQKGDFLIASGIEANKRIIKVFDNLTNILYSLDATGKSLPVFGSPNLYLPLDLVTYAGDKRTRVEIYNIATGKLVSDVSYDEIKVWSALEKPNGIIFSLTESYELIAYDYLLNKEIDRLHFDADEIYDFWSYMSEDFLWLFVDTRDQILMIDFNYEKSQFFLQQTFVKELRGPCKALGFVEQKNLLVAGSSSGVLTTYRLDDNENGVPLSLTPIIDDYAGTSIEDAERINTSLQKWLEERGVSGVPKKTMPNETTVLLDRNFVIDDNIDGFL